jgi:hypothetical protein
MWRNPTRHGRSLASLVHCLDHTDVRNADHLQIPTRSCHMLGGKLTNLLLNTSVVESGS